MATDPDREGEAISWHLCFVLGIDPQKAKRVTFHEITEKAVKEAFRKPKPLNLELVDAQQARRLLDRLVGYSLSPLLWHKIRPGLSAGRVQTAALRLIVGRQMEIDSFRPEEYWTIDAHLRGEGGEVQARYFGKNGKKVELPNIDAVNLVLEDVKDAQFAVTSIVPKERRKNPPLPFTTSTLQQEAARKFGFSVKKTMALAQMLYEGLELGKGGYTGLITYMRTDSTRISESARDEVCSFISDAFGNDYVGSPRKTKEKPGEQGAHEAIRPTSVLRNPQEIKPYLKPDQLKLYTLIWGRHVASHMAPAVYDTVTCNIDAAGHSFRVTGSRMKFPGFTKVYQEGSDNPIQKEKDIIPLSKGELLALIKIEPAQHYTEPPALYTEASLVKAMEENGIGRPSTYAPIIATLFDRDYIRRESKRLSPTDLGKTVDSLLYEYFPSIVDMRFTAEMEQKLDSVEEGEHQWKDILKDFWGPFKKQLDIVESEVDRVMVQDEPTGEVCEKCGRPMVIKRGRFGRFIACSGYPECKNTKPLLEKTGVACPKCQRDIVVRRSKRGRVFYGCSGYPDCDFVVWNKPVPDHKCPICGSFLVEVGGKKKGYKCSNSQCDFHSENL